MELFGCTQQDVCGHDVWSHPKYTGRELDEYLERCMAEEVEANFSKDIKNLSDAGFVKTGHEVSELSLRQLHFYAYYESKRGDEIELIYNPRKAKVKYCYKSTVYRTAKEALEAAIPVDMFIRLKQKYTALKAKCAEILAENAELRLRPGGPDYFAAKEHYENLAKK
jgi:hypothetical protein